MNVPKLRFSEFNDDWNTDKILNICEAKKGNGLSKNDITDDGYDCILYGELYTKYNEVIRRVESHTKLNSTNFVKSKMNDVIIPASGETPIDIAKASCVMLDNVILGGDLNVLTPNNIDGRFLSYQIGYKRKMELANLSQGNSVVHLYYDKFKNVKIKYPSIKEQNKIANTIELIDKKIELQSKKIEDLKLYKKGLYQALNNHIKEFKNVKLGNICNITTGKLDANAMKDNGKYRFYTCAEEYYFIDEYAFDTEALLISGNGANVGYIHYYKGKFNAYQRTYVLDNFSENINYIKIYLDNNFKNRISSEKRAGNTPYITLPTLTEMNIKIPYSTNDISKYNSINIIDLKIKLSEEKLKELNELKKGLMQNMFV